MVRIVNWQRNLNDYIISVQDRYVREGFVWGSFDCIHFIGDWIHILTGEDPIAEFRGTYTSKEEGEELLRSLTPEGTLLAALTLHFGQPIPPAHAHRGDIAYFEVPLRPEEAPIECCGIYFTSGRMRALFLAEGGLAPHRPRDTQHAFHIE